MTYHDAINEAIEALELMRGTYPYSPPCHSWEEKVEAHKAAKKAITKLNALKKPTEKELKK